MATEPNPNPNPNEPVTNVPAVVAAEPASPAAAPATPSTAASPGVAPVASPEPVGRPSSQAPDWRDARLAKVTARNHELTAEQATLKAELAALKAGQPAGPVVPEAEVNRRAQALADNRVFQESAVKIETLGRGEFPDFDSKLRIMANTLDLRDPAEQAKYHGFITAAMAAGGDDTHRLLYGLASDLNEASRIMSLPPAQQGVALAKRGQVEAQPRSQAPKPMAVPGGRSGASVNVDPTTADSDAMDDAAWFRSREAQVQATRSAGGRR